MVFTAAQLTTFFEDSNGLNLTPRTRTQLQNERITTIDDLGEFKNDDLDQVAKSLRSPGATVAVDGTITPTAPFQLGAKSLMQMKSSAQAVRYYETISRELTPGNMSWNTVKVFTEVRLILLIYVLREDVQVPVHPPI